MKKTKLIFAFVLTFVMLLSSFAFIPWAQVSATSVAAQGMTVNGVLNSDYYLLYPFTTSSVDVGFSMYGELINASSSTNQAGVGLQYPGYNTVGTYNQSLGTSVDPFANDVVPEMYWVNGWLVNITYRDPLFEGQGNKAYRNVWAFATFSDGLKAGGGWNNYETAPTTGVGGRQCNRYASTEPLQVLENDPRSFVAVATTDIYDNQSTVQWPLAKVEITINFNKVTKDVVLYKDVKLVINPKAIDGLADVQLSNRGEWDMGTNLLSYSYIYPEWGPCSYDYNYTTAVGNTEGTVMKSVIDTSVTVPFVTYNATAWGWRLSAPTGTNPFVHGSESVFVNGTYQLPITSAGGTYVIHTANNVTYLLFNSSFIGRSSTMRIQYKNYIYGSYTLGTPDAYTLAQIIEAAPKASSGVPGAPGDYVGFAAFWPVLSSYTPNGWASRLKSLVGVTDISAGVALPNVAFIIGQWDTMLAAGGQFRGVTEYGLTDELDGTNPFMIAPYDTTYATTAGYGIYAEYWPGAVTSPIVDREVQYMLDAVFYPFDLNNAIEKSSTREEIVYNVTKMDISMTSEGYPLAISLNVPESEFWYEDVWDYYASFSERVTFNGVLQYPLPDPFSPSFPRSVFSDVGTYWLDLMTNAPDGGRTVVLMIPWKDVPPAGTLIQISFSISTSTGTGGRYEWGIVGRDAATIDSAGLSMVSAILKDKGIEYGYAGADMNSTTMANMMPYVMSAFSKGTTSAAYKDSMGRTALRNNYCPTAIITTYGWYDAFYYWNSYGWFGSGQYYDATPIATSNIVIEGGYYANLAAYYLNDFTSANLNTMTGTITAWSCWSKHTYASNSTMGYAVVSTYLDENGTLMFAVWGYYGRDTYWASSWLQKDGAYEFQNSNAFYGATSVVLQINYKASQTNPTFSVVEVLGTISERLSEGVKGGIHPDP